jgi:hypothetical protein
VDNLMGTVQETVDSCSQIDERLLRAPEVAQILGLGRSKVYDILSFSASSSMACSVTVRTSQCARRAKGPFPSIHRARRQRFQARRFQSVASIIGVDSFTVVRLRSVFVERAGSMFPGSMGGFRRVRLPMSRLCRSSVAFCVSRNTLFVETRAAFGTSASAKRKVRFGRISQVRLVPKKRW